MNEYDNGKPFEKEFIVGQKYQNRHNGRYVVVSDTKITDTGLRLFRVLAWDDNVAEQLSKWSEVSTATQTKIVGDFDYLPAGDIVHWQVVE